MIVLLSLDTILLVRQTASPVQTLPPMHPVQIVKPAMQFDFNNQKIMVNDQELDFVNGTYKSTDIYNAHTATITDEVTNEAGNRAAAILTDNPGGSGTFYYLVGAMIKNNQQIYSKPILLGDRIKILSVQVYNPLSEDNGLIAVQYLTRAYGEPMSSEPTVQSIIRYAFQDDGNLINVLH